MQFGLSESQQILKNNARKFFAAECPASEVRRIMETETAHDEKLWGEMAAQGFLGVVIPEDAGGLALGNVELAALAEEMGRALVPGAFISTLLAGAIIDAAGSKKHLAEIASGKAKGTLALLESTANWDPDAVKMPALTGEKWFVPDAAAADFLVVAARDAGELALYLVDDATVKIEPMPAVDLTRRLYKVVFDQRRGRAAGAGRSGAKSSRPRARRRYGRVMRRNDRRHAADPGYRGRIRENP